MKYYLILLFLLIFSETRSQNYISFPDSNAVWCGQRGQLYFNPPNDQTQGWSYQQYITGDTIINGITYHKLEENGIFSWMDLFIPFNSGSSNYYHDYIGCFREDNKIIYFISPASSSENYLYNFNLNVGDTLPGNILTSGNYIMITRIDSIQILGNYRKQFFVSTVDTTLWQWPENFEYVSIIEGIGSTNGLNWTLTPYFENSGSLWAYKENGILLFTDAFTSSCEVTGEEELPDPNLSFDIYPNPAHNYLTVESKSDNALSEIELFDIQGKELIKIQPDSKKVVMDVSSFNPGIYIITFHGSNGFQHTSRFTVIK